jgi:hypothetical protein
MPTLFGNLTTAFNSAQSRKIFLLTELRITKFDQGFVCRTSNIYFNSQVEIFRQMGFPLPASISV